MLLLCYHRSPLNVLPVMKVSMQEMFYDIENAFHRVFQITTREQRVEFVTMCAALALFLEQIETWSEEHIRAFSEESNGNI